MTNAATRFKLPLPNPASTAGRPRFVAQALAEMTKAASDCSLTAFFFGRDGGIRTRDPLHPMQVRYQAALRPERERNYSRKKLSVHGSNPFFVVAQDFFCGFAQGRSKAARLPRQNAQALRKAADFKAHRGPAAHFGLRHRSPPRILLGPSARTMAGIR